MSRPAAFKFLLYVSGDTQNSALAVANLTAMCHAHLPDRYSIEVVDVFQHPKRARAHNVMMTPTLVKLEPHPMRYIVGTLSQPEPLLAALGLSALLLK